MHLKKRAVERIAGASKEDQLIEKIEFEYSNREDIAWSRAGGLLFRDFLAPSTNPFPPD